MAKLSDKKLIELGKKLNDFYETGYIDKKQALTWSFLKGLAGGLGAFLGGTLIIALLLWILSLFDFFAPVQEITESLRKN